MFFPLQDGKRRSSRSQANEGAEAARDPAFEVDPLPKRRPSAANKADGRVKTAKCWLQNSPCLMNLVTHGNSIFSYYLQTPVLSN